MTIQPVTRSDGGGATQVPLFTWNALANGDTGKPISIVDFPDRTVAFSGTFGAGGSVTIECSNDGVNFFALKDPSGAVIAKTAVGGCMIVEHPLQIRPHATAGDGTTAIVCILMARRGGR